MSVPSTSLHPLRAGLTAVATNAAFYEAANLLRANREPVQPPHQWVSRPGLEAVDVGDPARRPTVVSTPPGPGATAITQRTTRHVRDLYDPPWDP